MNNETRVVLSKLYSRLGPEDEDLFKLTELLMHESELLSTYKESVCDTVNAYHNEKKELKVVIQELITVLSATREYENDRSAYTKKQEELLLDTGAEVLIKAFRALDRY